MINETKQLLEKLSEFVNNTIQNIPYLNEYWHSWQQILLGLCLESLNKKLKSPIARKYACIAFWFVIKKLSLLLLSPFFFIMLIFERLMHRAFYRLLNNSRFLDAFLFAALIRSIFLLISSSPQKNKEGFSLLLMIVAVLALIEFAKSEKQAQAIAQNNQVE